MSLGIAFKGPEGIVLAADSRVTLNAQIPFQPPIPQPQQAQALPQFVLLPSTYDNATKLLRVKGQQYVCAVTYGIGVIGQQSPRTAHSYIPEFENELGNNGDRLSVSAFAQRLSDFFMRQWQTQMPQNLPAGQDMVFLVGGYDDGEPYGKIFEFLIPSRPNPVEQQIGTFGMVWGGQREYTDRIIQGFDERLLPLTQQFLNLQPDRIAELRNHLRNNLTAPIPWPFLPLQDCVDLSIFLIRTTISFQNWIIGIRGVGGKIDVVTITRANGLNIIQQKSILGERD